MWFRVHFNDFYNFRNSDKNVCRRLKHVCALIRLEKIIFQSTQYLFSHVINLRCAHFITGNAFTAFTVEYRRKKKMAKQLDESQISQFPFIFFVSLFTIPSTATTLPRLRALMVNGSPNNDYKPSASR